MRYTLVAMALLWLSSAVAQAESPQLRFTKTQLDSAFRSEGVAVADFNHDGKLDIAAGYVWYEAPSWTMHKIIEKLPEYDPKSYSNSFCTFTDDLNHDGWADIIVVDFPGTPTWWFENPQAADQPWKQYTCTPVTNNESPQYADVDGDGARELILGFAPADGDPDAPQRKMGFARPTSDPYAAWQLTAISTESAPGTQRYSHGLGIGDVNDDGKQDVLSTEGWWEAPGSASSEPWKFHTVDFGGVAAHMYVQDFDGDGDGDVLTSSPHAFGIWWYEQVGDGKWEKHEIDKSFSQTHSVCVADLNGDGLDDFVTGKRWWAHASGDPGVDEPAVICWFELTRKDGRPEWTKHQFDHDSGVGTQFEIADVNGDNLLDVITSNKKGVFYFEQTRE